MEKGAQEDKGVERGRREGARGGRGWRGRKKEGKGEGEGRRKNKTWLTKNC